MGCAIEKLDGVFVFRAGKATHANVEVAPMRVPVTANV